MEIEEGRVARIQPFCFLADGQSVFMGTGRLEAGDDVEMCFEGLVPMTRLFENPRYFDRALKIVGDGFADTSQNFKAGLGVRLSQINFRELE